MVAIIVLNWNGWRDTIDCLRSLLKLAYKDYFIYVGDNGSTNDSKEKISKFCELEGFCPKWYKIDEDFSESLDKRQIVLYDLQSNHGFARGNNILIQKASRYTPDYYLLLNNDTEVDPMFLTNLVDFQQCYPEKKVLTPIIYYYYNKYKIWNAGGDLIWGARKYHFADKDRMMVGDNEFIPCTFITGCALFCVPEVLMSDNKIFTELYFHGEEDFDFSLRMKKMGIQMGCVTSSYIFHKVGRTSSNIGNEIGLTYCYYLNRFINLRHHLNVISFYSFIIIYFPYVVRLLMTKGLKFTESVCFYWKVIRESFLLDGVSYSTFIKCLKKETV